MSRDEVTARLLCILYPTPALLWPQVCGNPALKWECIKVRSEKVEKVTYLKAGLAVRVSRQAMREYAEYNELKGEGK